MKKIFSSNVDINKNAYLNWRMNRHSDSNNFFTMAESFSNSTFILLDSILNDNTDKKADSIIFPILYSADHSIELYLKAIIIKIRNDNQSEEKLKITHDIDKLFEKAKELINKYYDNNVESLNEALSNLESYITELYSYIVKPDDKKKKPQMDFARYPLDTKNNDYFYVKSFDNVVVDIENFKNRFENITDSLESVYYYLEEKYEVQN